MLETVVSGILLAFITGITLLAYKHPAGYRNVVLIISPVGVGVGLGALTVDLFSILSNTSGGLLVAQEFPSATLASFSDELTSIRDLSARGLWGLAIALASAAYLTFLWFLPAMIGSKTQTSLK